MRLKPDHAAPIPPFSRFITNPSDSTAPPVAAAVFAVALTGIEPFPPSAEHLANHPLPGCRFTP